MYTISTQILLQYERRNCKNSQVLGISHLLGSDASHHDFFIKKFCFFLQLDDFHFFFKLSLFIFPLMTIKIILVITTDDIRLPVSVDNHSNLPVQFFISSATLRSEVQIMGMHSV